MVKLKNRIKVRRAELNITQQSLSERSGISRTSIVHIERGDQVPSGETMLKIAGALQCGINDIFFNENVIHGS